MVNRDDLCKAYDLVVSAPGGIVGIYDANQKILEAIQVLLEEPTSDWCIEHGSKANTPLLQALGRGIGMCQIYSLFPSKEMEHCEFIKVVMIPIEE